MHTRMERFNRTIEEEFVRYHVGLLGVVPERLVLLLEEYTLTTTGGMNEKACYCDGERTTARTHHDPVVDCVELRSS